MRKVTVPSGAEDHTAIIQKILAENAGKDTVTFPKGIYRTKSLEIPGDTHIVFEKGARLLFSDDFSAYPPVFSRWEGIDCYCMHPLFFINGVENVVIEGEGILDGGGDRWWDYIYTRRAVQKEPETEIEKMFAELNPGYRNQPGGGGGRQCQFLRPPLLQIYRSRNITLSGITLTNSPFWTLHTVYSQNLMIRDIMIKNPYVTPNTDGMDIESCTDVTIENCVVDVGDDGIALKSGSGKDGYEAQAPTENIRIRGCTVKQAHGGFVIGSETAGGINNVEIDNCTFIGTDRGIRIKTRRERGGHIRNIRATNIRMDNTICPITLNMYYKWGSDDPALYSLDPQPITNLTPTIENITISNVEATDCRGAAGFIAGLPEAPIQNVMIENSSFQVKAFPKENLEIEMYKGIPETDYSGFRVFFADIEFRNNSVNISPPIRIER